MVGVERQDMASGAESLHTALAGQRDNAIVGAFDIEAGNGSPAFG